MKNITKLTLLLIVLTQLIVAACNNKEPQKIYRVAMLASGDTFNDMSFLQNCKEGLERAKIDFNLDVEYNIDTTTIKYQERIDAYGDSHFDLIIAVGFMWDEAVVNAAKKYPNSEYIIVDTELSETQINVTSILFDVDEAAYSLGFLSAWWADANDNLDPKLAYVGALDIPQIRQFIEPFSNGADRYNQHYGRNVETSGVYAGDFFNMDLGKYLADSLIATGADLIFGVGSETGNGSLLSAKENGKTAIGVDVDQYYSFPEVSASMLSSAMKGLDNAIYNVVKIIVEYNIVGGRIYNGKLANEGVGTAPYHDYENMIPDSIKTEIESIKSGIIDGSITTGW